MKELTFLLLISLLCGCSSKQSAVALNWYARIDHAPGCGELNAALLAGKDTLLCPLEEALFNGDSLVARSLGKCYYIDLQAITNYKGLADFEVIDCADFDTFISHHIKGWPYDPDVQETIKI